MPRFEKTVLQVIPRLEGGGAERTTLEIAQAVVRAGGRALVMSAGGRLAREIEHAGGEIIEAPVATKNPLTIWTNALMIADVIRREGVDLLHARSRAPAWSALRAAHKTATPFVTTYHGAYSAKGPVKRLYNSSMLRADRVIANSRFTAEQIMANGGVAPDRLVVIPRGVDTDLFDPKKVSSSRINQLADAWGLGENQGLKLLLPARMTPWKGHETAIRALQTLKERASADGATGQSPALTLVFCGGAQGKAAYVRRLRALSEECGVRTMVHLVGDCADMPAAYAWADAVIAPSTEPEAFGRVAVEAGA
ncbi:MAG: glycosyltransferase family 4 protein, partial [Pseudomonadota bacterium]